MSFRGDHGVGDDLALGEEAAEWLLRLDESSPQPPDEYSHEQARNRAFYEWIETSPEHLRAFLETVETHRRLRLVDARHVIRVEALLRQRADVIPLHKEPLRPAMSRAEESAAGNRRAPRRPGSWARVSLRAVAAAACLVALGSGGYWWWLEQDVYATGIGEQRSTKLDDGSFIYLNTNSKVEVEFSAQARHVRLLRGEALFVVERDSSRPFTVSAGDAVVRAIGTQFNVRKHARGADVVVVEGAVQVTATDGLAGFPAQKLVAGEEAQVSGGRIAPRNRQVVAEALAWRQRRLIFHDARLAEVAAEFNRYNRTKIRIEGDAAKEILLSGIFDADRPQALMLYAAKSPEFAVEPEGNDWVIRGR